MKKELFTVQFPWILLAGILASGAAVWSRLIISNTPLGGGEYNFLVFLAGMGSAMPLALGFMIFGRWFLDRKPFSELLCLKAKSHVDCVVELSPQEWMGHCRDRLARRGFTATPGANGDGSFLIAFHKKKSEQVLGFSDNEFEGLATVQAAGEAGCRITSEMRMMDLIVVDTGETKALERLHNHLLGFEDDDFKREVPFTLVCGACVGIAAGVVFWNCESCPNALGILGSLGRASISMVIAGMWQIFKKWGDACGSALGVVSLLVCASFLAAAFR